MGPPYPHPCRPTRLSCSSTATHSGSTDSRKPSHRKENQFIYRAGSKLHAYDRDKAPYPSSFDRHVIELYVPITPPSVAGEHDAVQAMHPRRAHVRFKRLPHLRRLQSWNAPQTMFGHWYRRTSLLLPWLQQSYLYPFVPVGPLGRIMRERMARDQIRECNHALDRPCADCSIGWTRHG